MPGHDGVRDFLWMNNPPGTRTLRVCAQRRDFIEFLRSGLHSDSNPGLRISRSGLCALGEMREEVTTWVPAFLFYMDYMRKETGFRCWLPFAKMAAAALADEAATAAKRGRKARRRTACGTKRSRSGEKDGAGDEQRRCRARREERDGPQSQ